MNQNHEDGGRTNNTDPIVLRYLKVGGQSLLMKIAAGVMHEWFQYCKCLQVCVCVWVDG